MTTKIIDPKTGIVVRLAQDAEDLESCLKKIQDGDLSLIVQIGDGDRSLQVTPRRLRNWNPAKTT